MIGRLIFSTVACLLFWTVQAQADAPEQSAVTGEVRDRGHHDKVGATLWMETAEYDACARQAYLVATIMLDRALKDPTWTASTEQAEAGPGHETRPPAIILDVDETVLHNASYQAQLMRVGKEFDRESWNSWCRSLSSHAIVGARRFCIEAMDLGVTPFYLTNRRDEVRTSTLENLRRQGFPLPDNGVTLITNCGVTKTQRRAEIAEKYRILMLLGDNMADFTQASRSRPEDRVMAARQYATWWGTRWIILPNPV